MQLSAHFVDEAFVKPRHARRASQEAMKAGFDEYEGLQEVAIAKANVFLFHQQGGGEWKTLMEAIRAKDHGVCPVFIYDTDDHIEYVRPIHSSYWYYGIRDWDGRMLHRGESVHLPVAGDREDVEMFKDGMEAHGKKFDIIQNRWNIAQCYELARWCDAMTSSNKMLCDFYKDVVGCNNVGWFPNSMMLDTFPKFTVDYPDKKLRILWTGGDSHVEDIRSLREPMRRVLKRHPEVKVVIFGHMFPSIKEMVPEDQIEYHRWVHYDAYYDILGCMGHDINICPLVPHEFNKGKSAIKWYESSCLPNPPATLAANVGPYREIEHGKTGFLYNTPEEFEDYLEQLIANAGLRRHLGENAKKWVSLNRDAKLVTHEWILWVRDLIERRNRELST
jgi:glycosyltransferase involved in cell wall biosynthesis